MSDHTRAGHIFVTVGSTEFDALIEVAGSVRFAELAANQGFTKIVIQYGRGSARPHPDASKHLDVHAYDYKPSLAEDMSTAALVLSHAGAGTCLEALEAGKPLLVVVNDFLADNHQLELASKFNQEGYLEYTTPAKICERFVAMGAGKALKPYETGNPELFASWLNDLTGASGPGAR